MDARFEET